MLGEVTEWNLRDFLVVTKALSDETRVRALLALRDGELCLCQIIELLALAPSTISKHMSVLHQAGLVERNKKGRWHYYRLADATASPVVRKALDWAVDQLGDDDRIRRDRLTLKQVRARSLEELSACYRT